MALGRLPSVEFVCWHPFMRSAVGGHLAVHFAVHLSVQWAVHLAMHRSMHLATHPSMYQAVHPSCRRARTAASVVSSVVGIANWAVSDAEVKAQAELRCKVNAPSPQALIPCFTLELAARCCGDAATAMDTAIDATGPRRRPPGAA